MRNKLLKESEILQACADVLANNPQMHTKDCAAEDIEGHILLPSDSNAARWCPIGLIAAATHDLGGDMGHEDRCISILQTAIRNVNVVDWNDGASRRPAQVAKALEKAAQIALSQGD